MKRLLVGYDGSGPAMEAARLAGTLARGLGAEVTVLTVGQIAPLIVAPTGMIVHVAEERDFLPVAGEGVRLVESAGVPAQARVSIGDPVDSIVDTAGREGYDLVTMGHRGMGKIAGLVLGSVAKGVAEQAPCPVLVVQSRAPETIKRILAAVDGSEQARRAVETTVALAGAFAAKVTLLYVLDPKVLGAVADQGMKRQLRSAAERTGHQALEDAARLCEKAGIAYKTVLAVGRPAAIILKRARFRDYDLVAVGRRGLGSMARLRLGGVSDEVLRKAECPVLLVGEKVKSKITAGSGEK